jgi:DNA-binding transcriptional MerR regulator
MNPDRSQLLTADDAAIIAGVSKATLRDWTRRGILPRYGSPRCALYDWRDLATAKNADKPRRVEQRSA